MCTRCEVHICNVSVLFLKLMTLYQMQAKFELLVSRKHRQRCRKMFSHGGAPCIHPFNSHISYVVN